MIKSTYIFSGFSTQEHFGGKTSEFFKKDLMDASNIVFIPGGNGKNNKTDRYVNTDINWFKEIGIDFKKVVILDTTMKKEKMKLEINEADVIFLMGGNTLAQNNFLINYDLKQPIKDFDGVVIGVSAGAINLGEISLCSKDISEGVNETKMYEGIGRIKYTFEPHFNLKNTELLKNELYPISNKIDIYGLPNDGGVKIQDEKFIIIKGNIYLIKEKNVEIIERV